MSHCKVQAVLLAAMLIPTLKVSANPDCIKLADTITYDNSSSFSKQEKYNVRIEEFCSERYKKDNSASSLRIEASFVDIFDGTADGSGERIREEQEKQCKGKYGESRSNSVAAAEARTASTASLRVIEACLALHKSGLSQSATISNAGKQFGLTLRWNANSPNPINVIYAGPHLLESFDCRAAVKPFGLKTVKRASDLTVTIQ